MRARRLAVRTPSGDAAVDKPAGISGVAVMPTFPRRCCTADTYLGFRRNHYVTLLMGKSWPVQNIECRHPFRFFLAVALAVGFIFLGCGTGSPTEPVPPVPQIVYNDGIAKLRQPTPEITVCERNRTLITELQTGQRLMDQAHQKGNSYFIPPADPRTPYPEWMAKELDRRDAKHRSTSARYQRAALRATGLTPDALEYCAGYNDQYPRPRQCQTAFSELIADNAHLHPSAYQLGAIRACLETNAYHRESIESS